LVLMEGMPYSLVPNHRRAWGGGPKGESRARPTGPPGGNPGTRPLKRSMMLFGKTGCVHKLLGAGGQAEALSVIEKTSAGVAQERDASSGGHEDRRLAKGAWGFCTILGPQAGKGKLLRDNPWPADTRRKWESRHVKVRMGGRLMPHRRAHMDGAVGQGHPRRGTRRSLYSFFPFLRDGRRGDGFVVVES